MERIRVGVVGCGLIAQVMHLPYLRELSDRFVVGAVCDLSADARAHASALLGTNPAQHTDWRELLDEELNAILVCTSGSHADVVIEAAQRGIHVLVEKPLCFGLAEGEQMLAAARAHGTLMMVGYMKRYDPAYERFETLLGSDEEIRFVRVTTLESPPDQYVAHYPLAPPRDLPGSVRADLEQDDRARVTQALGEHDELVYRAYRFGLLDSLVHEFNLLRALLGEPELVRSAHFWMDGSAIHTSIAFESIECQLAWVLLDGVTHFEQELAFHSPTRRLTLSFPSPFLRNMPTRIGEVGGAAGTPASWVRDEVVGYDEAFRRELVAFHGAVTEGAAPPTDGLDALRDVALCEAIVHSFTTGEAAHIPTTKELA
jgi:predicted dehydrogenase